MNVIYGYIRSNTTITVFQLVFNSIIIIIIIIIINTIWKTVIVVLDGIYPYIIFLYCNHQMHRDFLTTLYMF
jgi:hypothetical protein